MFQIQLLIIIFDKQILMMLLYMETMWLILSQSKLTRYEVSKKFVTLEGAKMLVTKAASFVLPQNNSLPTLE
jgi:hypothetical protein